MSKIRDEFRINFVMNYPLGNLPPFPNHNFKAALMGAKWALEYAAKETNKNKLRQLAKELEER